MTADDFFSQFLPGFEIDGIEEDNERLIVEARAVEQSAI